MRLDNIESVSKNFKNSADALFGSEYYKNFTAEFAAGKIKVDKLFSDTNSVPSLKIQKHDFKNNDVNVQFDDINIADVLKAIDIKKDQSMSKSELKTRFKPKN